jgi:hypothetical protein
MTIRAEEVRAYRAALRLVVFLVDTAIAYSWDDGGFDWNRTDRQMDANSDGLLTPGEYLPVGAFMTLVNGPAMTEAWSALTAAVDDAQAVATKMASSPDPQQILAIRESSGQGIDWAAVRDGLAQYKPALSSATPMKLSYFDISTMSDVAYSVSVNASALWTNPPANLKALAPTFAIVTSGDSPYTYESRIIESVPDKTLGGVFPNAATEVPAAAWTQLLTGGWGGYTYSTGVGAPTITKVTLTPSEIPHGGGTLTVAATIQGAPTGVSAYIYGPGLGHTSSMVTMSPTTGGVYQGSVTIPASANVGWNEYYVSVSASNSSGSAYGGVVVYQH